jgi:restriction endonuclease S subunit
LKQEHIYKNYQRAGVMPHCYWSDFQSFSFNLPPRAIQEEIVATLDRIFTPGTTELADTLKMTDKAMDLVLASPSGETLAPIVEAQRLIRKSAQMVADVKAQMVAIVKASSSTSTLLSLKDVCSVAFGERITQKDHKGTLYPVYGGGESNFHTDRFNREGMTCKVARFAVSEKSMVLMINQKYWLMDSGFTISSKEKTKVVDEYLWWVLWANQARLTACSTGSCQKNISMDMFYTLEFGFPSVEVQTSVVSKIRMLQSQLTALESLQKQSEDNARFILESYLGAPVTEEATAHAPLAAVGGAGTGSVSEEDDTTEGDSTDHSVISHA